VNVSTKRSSWGTGFAIVLLLAFSPLSAQAVDFAHDILPVLKNRCAACHTNGVYKGGVNFDTRETTLRSKAVTPGKSGESALIERVLSTDPEVRMPPKSDALSSKEIAAFKAWIDAGAEWQPGFTFGKTGQSQPLKLQPPTLPAAIDGREHPVDRLVDQHQRQHQVTRTKPLHDDTFLRRVSLDLVGLLPSADVRREFHADQATDKRAKLIDRLLDDRRAYAEHWLTFWNDVLRNDYAGTGYIDGGRKAISDWLYKSLVDNKPYDQFVRELMLPRGDAEGFIKGLKWRGRVNASQIPEIQFAQNVSQVFLGINMKCASCHDSFIDVWKLEDAYGMAAVIAEQPLEIHRCDKAIGKQAQASFLWPELGTIDPKLPRDERLKRFGELLTSRDNGRLARTIVNRLWHRLLGRGIVQPVDIMANPPWSPELLEYLAIDLVEHDYDLKRTLRLIATSATYQSQTASPADVDSDDYVFRGPLSKRLTAEQFLDAVYDVTHTAPTKAVLATGDRAGQPIRASLVIADALQRSLGRPNREQVVTTRPEELSTLQALDLSNGQVMNDLVLRGAKYWRGREKGATSEQLCREIYLAALGRAPSVDELSVARDLVGEPAVDEGVADLLWTVFMLPEFQVIR
jgi:hypothetical protein